MTDYHSPEDRSDIADRSPHLRARVPDHVATGVFSTGAIVVTGPTEFIIDFLQTIGRPHRVAARVIIPHTVMPQFIEALAKNLSIYSDRFGMPPVPPGFAGPATASGATAVPQVLPHPNLQPPHSQPSPPTAAPTNVPSGAPTDVPPAGAPPVQGGSTLGAAFGSTDVFPGANVPAVPPGGGSVGGGSSEKRHAAGGAEGGDLPPESLPVRRPTPQEIYDDLKIPDTVLSGAYANGVMIGHGASEFGLDFLTSFYPQSAVSCRVFMAAGQIPRLLESLHQAMRQLANQRNLPRPPQQNPKDLPGNPF
jgi:hypothetical protein